jgi:hypothetical protein
MARWNSYTPSLRLRACAAQLVFSRTGSQAGGEGDYENPGAALLEILEPPMQHPFRRHCDNFLNLGPSHRLVSLETRPHYRVWGCVSRQPLSGTALSSYLKQA